MNNTVAKTYKEANDLWGYPQKYKKLEIYPVKLKDTEYLDLLHSLMIHPKNHIPDQTILKMSYLKFLLYVVFHGEKDVMAIWEKLRKFISYITKVEAENIEIEYAENKNPTGEHDRIIIRIIINSMILKEEEFRHIREIVLEQNGIGVNYIDDYNPELEDKFRRMNWSSEGITLQDEIFTFCALTNKDINEISNYTLFQFKMEMEKTMALLNYKIYRPLEAAGSIEVKGGKIPHFLYRSDRRRGRYDNMFIRKDQYVANNDIFKVS